MSTKIYNGFKFNTQNFQEIFNFIQEIRKEFNSIAREEYLKIFARTLAFKVDDISLSSSKNEEQSKSLRTPYHETMDEISKRQEDIKIKRRRDPGVDFGFEFVIFLYNGSFYGIFYTDNRILEEKFRSNEFITDFSYWDNTDPDDTVSDDEWENRENVWNYIFQASSVPSQVGITAEIVSNDNIRLPTFDQILSFFPSKEERAKQWARILVSSEISKERGINNISDFIKLDREIDSDCLLKERLDEIYKNLLQVLPDVTLDNAL